MAASKANLALRRLLAFAVDWLLIVAWAAVLFGVAMTIYSGHPPSPAGPWRLEAVGFVCMTAPVVLYFSLTESSAWQATVGKRVLNLRVVHAGVARAAFGRTLLRNLIKFIPWEMGHLVANQAIFSTRSGVPGWIYIPLLLAFACPVWWVVSIFARGRAPYDVVTSTRVVDGHTITAAESA